LTKLQLFYAIFVSMFLTDSSHAVKGMGYNRTGAAQHEPVTLEWGRFIGQNRCVIMAEIAPEIVHAAAKVLPNFYNPACF
jgi:hypothetical protein